MPKQTDGPDIDESEIARALGRALSLEEQRGLVLLRQRPEPPHTTQGSGGFGGAKPPA